MANTVRLFDGVGGNAKITLNDQAKIEAKVGSGASVLGNDITLAKNVKGNAEFEMSENATLNLDAGAADTKKPTDDKDKGDNVTMNVTGNVHVGGDLNMNDKSHKEDFRGAAIGTVNKGTLSSTAENCTTYIGAQKK